ncbi:MAG TPA: GDSL-type esterase/lipase family protein [Reyranella sp.]|nr:GDSL-type esterase/lipase family protein [Reyranella sp.]
MLGRAGLVLVSIVIGLVALELGLRAANGYLGDWSNLVLDARSVLARTEGQRFQHDELLGHVPRGGLRSNGKEAPPPGERPTLAVGDSYTYGEEVADDETWPALLQAHTGHPVLNGGVSGYGFDQTVLRAESLAAKYHPGAIVVSFIADDIGRTEMSRIWGAEKPYFDIEKNALVLRNVPVPPRPAARTTLSFWQRTLGYSYLVDFVLRRLDLLHDWFGDHVRVHPEGMGEQIACRLTDRLAELQRLSQAPVLVVAEYDPVVWDEPKLAPEQRRLTQGLLGCASQRGLATLDSYDRLAAADKPRALYKVWHMNKAGNDLIAGMIAKALADHGK